MAVPGFEQMNKYLIFVLGEEEYGLEILKVKEIIGLMMITKVPDMPTFVRGVVNLRGTVIPVVDLRQKFGMEKVKDTEETCVVVVDLGETFIGIVVDRVSEVLDIPDAQIEELPFLGADLDTSFIYGVGKLKDKVCILLDIAKVLSGDAASLQQPL